ncbi:MAG: DUF1667 domain-containing protein [Clostridia bacterium]|nr:DUF1667 domain-containing protein [Clostridia bacterium]
MERNLTCIICPRGCSLTVNVDGDKTTVLGHGCPKGLQYGIDEVLNPVRTVTSIVRVSNREDTMVSVKTADPISKAEIFNLMKIIREAEVTAPVKIGDIIIENVFGTNVIATKDVK